MSEFKCKMCGGRLEVQSGQSIAECEYCGTTQTLPRLDDDRRENLYDRANHFRRSNDFDRAAGIYEKILNEDPSDAEAYWSLVLCRYGIEYVEEPGSHKRVPTVNRAQFTSIFDDEDYKAALAHATAEQKGVYETEAAAINELQKGILAISQNEKPFDVFICYKETDDAGRRTPDSVLANDLYHQLVQEGFKVFFSRITLEDKLGTAYEPYIFAALNSAKVMVVLGTKPEYFKAVWVRNEWSRYLALVKKSGGKKVLIPAFKDMDPYDLPEEFSHLQAQDMSKLGFMQDLIRGIKKLTGKDAPANERVQTTVVSGGVNTEALLKRAFLYLEDGNWQSADEYCEKVLDLEPENGEAYLVKLMLALKCPRREALAEQEQRFDDRAEYEKTLRFADDRLKAELRADLDAIQERLNRAAYDKAMQRKAAITTSAEAAEVAELFAALGGFKDSEQQRAACEEQGKRLSEQEAEAKAAAAKRRKRDLRILAVVAVLAAIAYGVWAKVLDPLVTYGKAKQMQEQGRYTEAVEIYEELGDYKDCSERKMECAYQNAIALYESGNYEQALDEFNHMKKYEDSAEYLLKATYGYIEQLNKEGNYKEAVEAFKRSQMYPTPSTMQDCVVEAYIGYAKDLEKEHEYDQAISCFEAVADKRDVEDLINDALYEKAAYYMQNTEQTKEELEKLIEIGYPGAEELYKEVFSWKAAVILNDEWDKTTAKATMKDTDYWYAHFQISGGEPGKRQKLKIEWILPNGSRAIEDHWLSVDGDIFMSSQWYENGTVAGTLTVRVYDEQNNLIGEASAQIVK